MSGPIITNLRWKPARPGHPDVGLKGWITAWLDGRYAIEVTLRETLAGGLAIAFAQHRDGQKILRSAFRPATDEARRELQTAILAALGSAVAP